MLGTYAHRLAPHSRLASRTTPASYRSTSTHARPLRGDDLGPTRNDAHQTFRARRDGRDKELPLPPLLDPVILERRSCWQSNKARPVIAELTPFQRKLQANPYAHALVSPVRQCRALSVLLPAAFLMSLHARPHPTTEDPWLLPVSLTTDKVHLGPSYRFLGSQFVATQLGKKKLWARGVYARMEEKLGATNTKKMVWREDLPEFILDLMQQQLIKKLSWSFGFRGRLTPVASPGAGDIDHVDNVSCVLMFGSLRTRADHFQDRTNDMAAELDKWTSYIVKSYADKLDPHASRAVTHSSPAWFLGPLVAHLQPRLRFAELEFRSTDWRGKKVALYSLADLLGEDKARVLVAESKYAGERCVVVKEARHNVPIEILLMRLQAYLARPGP